MKLATCSLFIAIAVFTLSISCASPDMVGKKTVEHLNKKYGERFSVVSVNMNRDEGNWGSANLMLSPVQDRSLTFSAVYDYSADRLIWEDYKGVIWNREIGNEARSILKSVSGTVTVMARIWARGSIALDSMNLPHKKSYRDILPLLEKPAVSFDVNIHSKDPCAGDPWPYNDLISTADFFREKGFAKVMVSAKHFCSENKDKPYQTLRFKLTGEHHNPSLHSIRKLAIKNGESPVDRKLSSLFSDARKLHESGDVTGALSLYLTIIRIHDNPYRYDAYAPVESGFVIESAFHAAGIEKERGNRIQARKLYSLVAERTKYIEVKSDFYAMEKEAMQYLTGN
jgi:hypothetical protein